MESIRRNPLQLAHTTSAELAAIAGRIDRAQRRAITGLAIERPSDAPAAWSKIHALSSGRTDQEVYQSGMGSARTLLDMADSTLGTAANVFNRAIERAVQMTSESYSDQDRQQTAGEIASLRLELITLANTTLGDRSLFAGDAFHGAAFDASGTYLGAAATSAIRIGPGEDMVVALDGAQVFQGGTDAFQVLADLETALAAGDASAVGATLGGLHAAHEHLVEGRQSVGFLQTRLEDAQLVSENLSALLNERLSDLVAADPVATYQEFAALKTSYEAALQVTATSAGQNLFAFLR